MLYIGVIILCVMQGKGCGELKLRLTYVPLPRVNPMVGQRGNFFVSPKAGKDFPMMVSGNPKSTSAYYIAKVGSESQKGPIKYSTVVCFAAHFMLETYACTLHEF